MGRQSFKNYGQRAKLLDDFTIISGRYSIQKNAEKLILLDIIKKLDLNLNDCCLDIGCGVGNFLIPLSFIVKNITGIDHDLIMKKLIKRFPILDNIKLIAGNFLDLQINEKFDKVIIYSVLHYLESEGEVLDFINKALSILNPGGKVLLGDIPNKSKRSRFLSSKEGKKFQLEWKKKISETQEENDSTSILSKLPIDNDLVEFRDDFLLKILKDLKSKGYHASILSQPQELPFGFTREDILVEKL